MLPCIALHHSDCSLTTGEGVAGGDMSTGGVALAGEFGLIWAVGKVIQAVGGNRETSAQFLPTPLPSHSPSIAAPSSPSLHRPMVVPSCQARA